MNQEEFANMIEKKRVLTDFPCSTEKILVDQCYARTGFDKDACAGVINNYKSCRKFWGEVAKERRRAGISPVTPSAEEREKIKLYYKEHRRIPNFKEAL